MNGTNHFRISASALVIGLSTVGCQSDDAPPATASALAAEPQAMGGEREAFYLHARAQAEAKKGALAEALDLMERAVALSPQDAGYRMALAELYMQSGRFVSAERTFADTIILNPANVRASLYLGMSRAAQGKALAALAALEKVEDRAAPGDLGLAYALSGNPERAVALLENAARAESADGRVRQNLALSYALKGDWEKAKIVAAQDVSPADLEKRLQQWARLAAPGAQNVQVAAFFGITPIEDPGQPTRLALSVPDAAPVVLQAEATLPVVASAATLPVQTAAFVTPPVDAVTAPPSIHKAMATPMPPSAPVRAPVMQQAARSGRYVVQIGAYGTRAQAETAWTAAEKRYGFSQERRIITTVIAPDNKGVFHRLAIQGFQSSAEAARACKAVKSKGGDCFVRVLGAAAQPTRIAARR